MTVKELNKSQLEELKSVFFWGEDTENLVPENCTTETDIPDELIFNHYAGIDFVDDDFFSNTIENTPLHIPF